MNTLKCQEECAYVCAHTRACVRECVSERQRQRQTGDRDERSSSHELKILHLI